MKVKKCKYCGSENFVLENKTQLDIMEANQVALKCVDCGKWLKWCPKDERQYYVEKVDKDKVIADLEAKLAESESCTGMLHHHLTDKAIEIEMLGEEIAELKQQLAEKKQELSDRESKWARWNKKDRVDFAIAELEKMKDYFVEESEDADGFKTDDWIIIKDACEVAEYIDQLIRELEENEYEI